MVNHERERERVKERGGGVREGGKPKRAITAAKASVLDSCWLDKGLLSWKRHHG